MGLLFIYHILFSGKILHNVFICAIMSTYDCTARSLFGVPY